jgi:hypothetical protein
LYGIALYGIALYGIAWHCSPNDSWDINREKTWHYIQPDMDVMWCDMMYAMDGCMQWMPREERTVL